MDAAELVADELSPVGAVDVAAAELVGVGAGAVVAVGVGVGDGEVVGVGLGLGPECVCFGLLGARTLKCRAGPSVRRVPFARTQAR